MLCHSGDGSLTPEEEPWLHRAVNYTASLLGWGRGAGCSSPCPESPHCVLAGFS